LPVGGLFSASPPVWRFNLGNGCRSNRGPLWSALVDNLLDLLTGKLAAIFLRILNRIARGIFGHWGVRVAAAASSQSAAKPADNQNSNDSSKHFLFPFESILCRNWRLCQLAQSSIRKGQWSRMKECFDLTKLIWEMTVLTLFAGSMLLAIFRNAKGN